MEFKYVLSYRLCDNVHQNKVATYCLGIFDYFHVSCTRLLLEIQKKLIFFWYALQFFPLSEIEGYDQNLYSAEGLPTYFESGLLYYMLELNCSFMTQPYGFYFLMFESSGIGVK